MYGAAAIRFFDDDVALFVLLRAGSAMRRDLLEPEPSIWCIVRFAFPPLPSLGLGPSNWLRDASDVRAYQIQDNIIVESIPNTRPTWST